MAPVDGLCFSGDNLPESFQIVEGAGRPAPTLAVECRDACCELQTCKAFVLTVTTESR